MLGMRVNSLFLLSFCRNNPLLTSELCLDRTGERFFHISTWFLSVIVGFIIATSTMSVAGRYASMFFMASGFAGSSVSHVNILIQRSDRLSTFDHEILGFALLMVWVSNAIPRPPAKRSVALGLVNGIGNLGNL